LRPWIHHSLALILAGLSLAIGTSLHAAMQAPESSGSELSRDAAEQRLQELSQEIGALQANLEEARSEHRREQTELRELDLRIDRSARDIRNLEEQQGVQQSELHRLEADRKAHLGNLSDRQGQLSEVLRSAYRLNRYSRLRLVLNQDDPAKLNRMLAYYDFFNRQQVREISLLRESLEALERMHILISDELAKLAATRQQLDESLQQLNGQRQDRLDLIADLNGRIGDDEARLIELERDREDLVRLLERLEDALSDIPADLGTRLGVAQQKGRLPMPTPGKIFHAFGQRRGGSLYWQGWLVAAEPGSEVRSVAYGRVAFADWLRGYGLILIIDHGDGFLSLYGNNESLLADVGDWVEPGELISVVGTNPGMSQGLYFELRKDGKAVDPAAWIQR